MVQLLHIPRGTIDCTLLSSNRCVNLSQIIPVWKYLNYQMMLKVNLIHITREYVILSTRQYYFKNCWIRKVALSDICNTVRNKMSQIDEVDAISGLNIQMKAILIKYTLLVIFEFNLITTQ